LRIRIAKLASIPGELLRERSLLPSGTAIDMPPSLLARADEVIE
jgi:hypothetical protein